MRNKITIHLILIFCSLGSTAQNYAPAAGVVGSSAIHKDSSVFVNWAKDCRITRGYQDISNPSLGFASVGDSTMGTGKAQANSIVSLGDGGSAICSFVKPITNGNGYDFAVFENSFNDSFLELAFVEVSSDGVNYVRFPSHSLSDTTVQYDNAAIMDPTKINNLAGKYRAGYGTPFDLAELAGKSNLDINAVTHVKIIDVVGSLLKAYVSFDSFGNKINDPWSTPFPSGGFDLDAVGVIHENNITSTNAVHSENEISFYPNPALSNNVLKVLSSADIDSLELIDINGKVLKSSSVKEIDLNEIPTGLYFLKIQKDRAITLRKLIVL